jgi:hypothetical protein
MVLAERFRAVVAELSTGSFIELSAGPPTPQREEYHRHHDRDHSGVGISCLSAVDLAEVLTAYMRTLLREKQHRIRCRAGRLLHELASRAAPHCPAPWPRPASSPRPASEQPPVAQFGQGRGHPGPLAV